MNTRFLVGCSFVVLMGCGSDKPVAPTEGTPLAPYTDATVDKNNDYIAPPPGPKTGLHIVMAPTAQLFIGKWENKSELCNLEVRADQTCYIHCTDPGAIEPDDKFTGTWNIEGAQMVMNITPNWWHGKVVRVEYDEKEKALFKVQPNGERTFVFDKVK